MKTVTKEIYVPNYFIDSVNRCIEEHKNCDYLNINFGVNEKYNPHMLKIKISYEIPEKKIQITESDLDLAIAYADRKFSSSNIGALKYMDILKDRLFGDR